MKVLNAELVKVGRIAWLFGWYPPGLIDVAYFISVAVSLKIQRISIMSMIFAFYHQKNQTCSAKSTIFWKSQQNLVANLTQ